MTTRRMKNTGLCPALTCLVLTLPSLAGSAFGGSVYTRDGKQSDGDLRFNDSGALIVRSSTGTTATVELTNILRARFAPGFFYSSGSLLPNGWAVQDYGETRGFTRLDGDVFTMRAESQTTNASACHFVGRAMHSNGEIIAHVEDVGGAGDGRVGLMMRAHVSGSTFAALACDRNGRVVFDYRPDSDRKELRSRVVTTIPSPVWLRLQKSEKTVIASASRDGQTWQSVTEPVKFSVERTWREGEGDLHLLRASFGLFVASRGRDTICTARVSQVAMTLDGLLGEYFAGQNFREFKFARLDPQVRFNWGMGSPDALLDKDDFSVRWNGQLMPRKSGAYRFYFDADDRAQLWIDGEAIPQTSFKTPDKQRPPNAVRLIAGKPVEVKMEFSNSNGPAAVKLGWALVEIIPQTGDRQPGGKPGVALAGRTPEVIGMTNFIFPFLATNSPERTLIAAASNGVPVVRGVLLRNGTFLAGTVTSANESAVRVTVLGRKDVPVLNSKVARIVARPPRQALPYEIAAGRSGVFLKNRDFLECEFRGIEWGSLSTSSVLFGVKRFGLDGGEVLVIVMNDCVHDARAHEVCLLDGSVLRASKVSATERGVALEEPLLGKLFVPSSDLFEIRFSGDRANDAKSAARPNLE